MAVMLWAAGLALCQPAAQAMGRKPAPPAPLTGKRVIELAPVRNVRIEMPDQKFHDFGQDFAQRLENDLSQSGRYIVEVPPVHGATVEARAQGPAPKYDWPGSVTPAAKLTIKVEAMSFQTGTRGERMFYGFNERFRTPFNDGFEERYNEFPLRTVSFEPNWFDRTFDGRGLAPFDSRSGLDLGDGFGIDALFAWLAVKYAAYHAEIHLRIDIDAPLGGINEYRLVTVSGEGFFFDIAGAYEGYSAGIRIARRDAMAYALGNAISGAYAAVDRAIAPLPLTARVDSVTADATRLLGTGPNAAVVPGTRYEVVGHPETQLQAIESNSSGTSAMLVAGDPMLAMPGALLREVLPGQAPPLQQRLAARALDGAAGLSQAGASSAADEPAPAAVENITLPWNNAPKTDLSGLAPAISWAEAFLKSLLEAAFLPYRIWRYFEYDQSYKVAASYGATDPTDLDSWSQAARDTPWARQIGLADAPTTGSPSDVLSAPVIAVIDSGVDYNHATIHDHLWLNPEPVKIAGSGPADRKDNYGWDFISGDSHPYDDGYHGTEIASLLAAVAPASKIMALKVFNPWGITSSSALYGAFQYAVDHGARIIVCGWATRRDSQAIRQGVAYARAHGVVVVAAAGDRGDDISQVAAYPAALAGQYDNVLAVAGVTTDDELVQASGAYSNFGPSIVGIAAPGEALRVATPRAGLATDSSTGLAAAITAGALARLLLADPTTASGGPAGWVQALRSEADPVPSLAGAVAGGLRLRIRH